MSPKPRVRFTARERELLRSAFHYCAEVPSLEWLEAEFGDEDPSPKDQRVLDQLAAKLEAWS